MPLNQQAEEERPAEGVVLGTWGNSVTSAQWLLGGWCLQPQGVPGAPASPFLHRGPGPWETEATR